MLHRSSRKHRREVDQATCPEKDLKKAITRTKLSALSTQRDCIKCLVCTALVLIRGRDTGSLRASHRIQGKAKSGPVIASLEVPANGIHKEQQC